jgi:hypothetical protein
MELRLSVTPTHSIQYMESRLSVKTHTLNIHGVAKSKVFGTYFKALIKS